MTPLHPQRVGLNLSSTGEHPVARDPELAKQKPKWNDFTNPDYRHYLLKVFLINLAPWIVYIVVRVLHHVSSSK